LDDIVVKHMRRDSQARLRAVDLRASWPPGVTEGGPAGLADAAYP